MKRMGCQRPQNQFEEDINQVKKKKRHIKPLDLFHKNRREGDALTYTRIV